MSTIKNEAKRLIRKLSTPEKILLVEDVWDSITPEDSSIPIPVSHQRELDRRLKKLKSKQGKLLTLDELRIKIAKRK